LSREDKDRPEVDWSATFARRGRLDSFRDERSDAFYTTKLISSSKAQRFELSSAVTNSIGMRRQERDQPMSYIFPLTILLMVLSPVLIPAILTAYHAVVRWSRLDAPATSTAYQRMAAGRLAAAAA
jgi:hypothetical protein